MGPSRRGCRGQVRCRECGQTQAAGRFCGHCGAQLADSPDGPPEASPDAEASTFDAPEPSPPNGRRQALRLSGGLIGLVLLLLVVLALVDRPTDGSGRVSLPAPGARTDQQEASGRAPTPEPSFAEDVLVDQFASPTGTVLVFDDGREAALVLDVDAGQLLAGLRLPGQRAGDQPYPLFETGGAVIVGWGEVWAVWPGSERPMRSLGRADHAVPHVVDGQVWLVDHPERRTGLGTRTWRLVTVEGEIVHETQGHDGLRLVRGVPGGLALEDSEARIVRYDIETGELDDWYLGRQAARLGDATERVVAWCGVNCVRLFVSDSSGVRSFRRDDVVAFRARSMWLSPDGDQLAVVADVRAERGAVVPELMVIDLDRMRSLTTERVPRGPTYGDWSGDGEQFFFWIHAADPVPRDAPKVLGRWTEQHGIEQTELDPGEARPGPFVALDVEATPGLFPATWSPPPLGAPPQDWQVYEGERLSLHHPADWSVRSEPWIAEAIAPRSIVSAASFDLAGVAPLDDADRQCSRAFPEEPIRAVGPADVLLVVQAPTYADDDDPVPLLGSSLMTGDELGAARASFADQGGICGSAHATFHTLAGRIGGWRYEAWLVAGLEAPQERVDAAVAVFNSFRPDPPE